MDLDVARFALDGENAAADAANSQILSPSKAR